MLALNTDRLLIIPCSLHIAKAMIFNRDYLQTFLLAAVPDDWPSPEIKAYLPFYIEALEHDPNSLGWGIWIVIESKNKEVIGNVDFKGKPNESGSVEVSYSIHSSYRGNGYAFEAVKAVTDWAFNNDAVQNIYAQCDFANIGSIKVLQKLGASDVTEAHAELLEWKLARERYN